MKIKKLWISKYKNVEDQLFEFKEGPLITLLVGQNGLGKSNLIEALTLIFRWVDLADSARDLTEASLENYFEFELDYVSHDNFLKIKTDEGSIKIFECVNADFEIQRELPFSIFKASKKTLLPDFILSYYSGENKRSKQFFRRHGEKRDFNLKRGSSAIEAPTLGRMFYTEQNFGELLFFVLWVFKEDETYGKYIKELFSEFSGIELSSQLEISFSNPDFFNVKDHVGLNEIIDSGYSYIDGLWNLTGDVEKLMSILFDNNLSKSAPRMLVESSKTVEYDELISFDKLNFEELRKTCIEHFKTPAKLFDVLEAANRIGIIHEIKTDLKKNGATIEHDFSELSEGEQQLLTVIGLVLITGDSDTLFLLDEPDTHLNPRWQRDYVNLLERFNINDENSQIIVATHSPLIVQSSEKADVFLFKKNESGVHIDNGNHQIHNWRIDQVLVSEYFGLVSSRPPALDEFIELRNEILSKDEITEEDLKTLDKIEEEEGMLPTGESITDIRTMHYLHKVLNKLPHDKD